MKVGITGQTGFIGSHLYNFLKSSNSELELVDYHRAMFLEDAKLDSFVHECDVIVHLAAQNRSNDNDSLYQNNVGLIEKLISSCERMNTKPKIIYASSTQESKDNAYGLSKLHGRDLFQSWVSKFNSQVISLVIPNVFGPFGKPGYNSFISTFSHSLIIGETPKIIDDNDIELIYVNDLVKKIYLEIERKNQKGLFIRIIEPTVNIKVSAVLDILVKFKNTYLKDGLMPDIRQGSFELDLFNTFRSYIPFSHFPVSLKDHRDNRGTFVEIIRTMTGGQTSFSRTLKGITRGNHYHTRKIERFTVIQGQARIRLRKINTSEVYSFDVCGSDTSYIDIPIWYTHNITNIGEEDLLTVFWINESYDPKDPDTYFENV